MVRKAILRSFDGQTYQATVQLPGSEKAYLEDVAVARNIAATEMTGGRNVAVLFFDENNPRDAVVIAVYT